MVSYINYFSTLLNILLQLRSALLTRNEYELSNWNKRDRFLKKFWCCVGGVYHKESPALINAVTTHVKKYANFSRVFDVTANQLRHVTRLSCHSVILTKERQSFHAPFSSWLRLSGEFFLDDGCQNPEKFVSHIGSDVQRFLEGEENQTTERKTELWTQWF